MEVELHYWRDGDFQTLKDAATDAGPEWPDYAAFCLEYERGLRKSAFQLLDAFIFQMERAPFAERSRFTRWLLRTAEGRAGRRNVIPHPLQIRIIEPTLLEWIEIEPNCAEPHYWIGDREHLEKAFALDSSAPTIRRQLVLSLLSGVAYSTHHLPDGYLGDVTKDMAVLDRAERLIEDLPNDDDRTAYFADIAEERFAIDRYIQSHKSGTGSSS